MSDDLDKKALKKLRKKEKKERKKKEEAGEATPAPVAETPVEDEAASKAERKKLRKEQKRKRKAAEAEASKGEAEKKEKKAKVSQKSSTNGPYQQPLPKCGSFKKAFYIQSEITGKQTEEEIQAFREKNCITITGNKCVYNPVMGFKDINFSDDVLKCCAKFERPTPIQSQCWPILNSGRDIIGIAETGSGKTMAFTLPGMVHILDQVTGSNKRKPVMLVIAPTRELAMQSSEVITVAGKHCGLTSMCIFGGVPKYEQKKTLRRGVDVIVATPGRLKDLVEEGSCDLSGITYLVLDEADRMLDDGFEKDIRAIIGATHPERQIAMFSATWPKSIQELAHEFLEDPVKVTIGSDDLAASANVTQIVEVVDEYTRDNKITDLLKKYHSSRKNRVLIFVLYKKEAVRVERMLQKRGWRCVSVHGDKMQNQRTEAVEKFKSGQVPLLIATDVAARGLDIPGVEFVLNYSFPLTIEDYVHRIGRTGRGGKKGTSHTFFTNFDKPRAGELANLLRDSNQTIPEELLKFGTHVKKKEHKLYGAFAKDVDMTKKATKITFDSDDE